MKMVSAGAPSRKPAPVKSGSGIGMGVRKGATRTEQVNKSKSKYAPMPRSSGSFGTLEDEIN